MTVTLESALDNAWEAACKALDDGVNEIYIDSKENRCPVDKGDLKNSAQNELIVDTDEEHTRQISYGTDHAVPPHEILYLHHTHGGSKYLENPVKEHSKALVGNIKSEMEGALDR